MYTKLEVAQVAHLISVILCKNLGHQILHQSTRRAVIGERFRIICVLRYFSNYVKYYFVLFILCNDQKSATAIKIMYFVGTDNVGYKNTFPKRHLG
jgi:hypothetical protein